MSQRRKLYERIKNNPSNVTFGDLKNLLEWYGFEERKQKSGSSHRFFYKKGCDPLNVPYARPVGSVYVRKAIRLIESCCEMDEE